MSKIAAVIFDWSGTTVDFGSRAPVVAIHESFQAAGYPLDESTIRSLMGQHKRDHIRGMLQLPHLSSVFRERTGRLPDELDVGQFYDAFQIELLRILPKFAEPIPGVLATVEALRGRGIRIGGTTGFTRVMMDILEPAAAAHGYRPDKALCADEVPAGRPAPWACFRLAEHFGIYPMSRLAKVGDTVVDVQEGLNAGMFTVAVAATGNEVGLSESQLAALPASEREGLIAAARERLRAAGAHAVIDSVAELLDILPTT